MVMHRPVELAPFIRRNPVPGTVAQHDTELPCVLFCTVPVPERRETIIYGIANGFVGRPNDRATTKDARNPVRELRCRFGR